MDGHDVDEHTITSAQIELFKRAFHHFDTYCKGTINTDDLMNRILSAENELTQQEIDGISQILKRIGNNKDISFEKFTKFVLSAEKCLANDSADVREQRLCNVLLKYKRRSIISTLDQDMKAHYTHVVGHYAAGARLIGLTEKQLAKHLTLLTSNTATSPYLQPVCPIITGGGAEDKKRMKKKARVLEKPQEVPPLIEVHVPPSEKTTSNKCPVLDEKYSMQRPHHSAGIFSFLHTTPLPIVKLDCKKQHFTVEDLPMIRNKVHNALEEYRKKKESAREKLTQIHQAITDIEGIRSPLLQLQHKRVLEAYNFTPSHVPRNIESYFRKSAQLKIWMSK